MAASDGFFATTRWTMVAAAANSNSPQAAVALEELCGTYWFPLYAYVRRHGFGKEDAEDLTQAFFAKLLERRDLGGLDREHGRFRAFLLAAVKNFLSNERDRAGRLKRGGHLTHFALDWQSADTQFQVADVGSRSPDQAFDREWAITLLEKVIVRLREEFEAEGKGCKFDGMKDFLTVDREDASYAARAAQLGMDESALRVAVHRLRKRYRALLRREVAQTLSDPAMVAEELGVLVGAFG